MLDRNGRTYTDSVTQVIRICKQDAHYSLILHALPVFSSLLCVLLLLMSMSQCVCAIKRLLTYLLTLLKSFSQSSSKLLSPLRTIYTTFDLHQDFISSPHTPVGHTHGRALLQHNQFHLKTNLINIGIGTQATNENTDGIGERSK